MNTNLRLLIIFIVTVLSVILVLYSIYSMIVSNYHRMTDPQDSYSISEEV